MSKPISSAMALILLSCAVQAARASDLDEFKVKREAVYAFAEPPTVTRRDDIVTITFTSKGWCDVTVAIEDQGGRIVRHLASGILGDKAPPPLAKGRKKQTLIWDGKDDLGRYIDDKESIVIRVSLGLKPQFERNLFWTPYKHITKGHQPLVRACPEGVLIYEGRMFDHVRLFDHEGKYLRTVYPFPGKKVQEIPDLHWKSFPQDGARLPMKEWFRQCTLLTSGTNSNHPWKGFGAMRRAHDGHGADNPHHAASAMAVQGTRIALMMHRLNNLDTFGGTAGVKLNGPSVSIRHLRGGLVQMGGKETVEVGPTSAAISPDGKTLYLAGYHWLSRSGQYWITNNWLNGVVKLDLNGDGKMQTFAGNLKKYGPKTASTKDLELPIAVACGRQGRVYVADYMGDRVQVYSPAGKVLKTIAVPKPAQLSVHQRSGELFVFSWRIGNVNLTRKIKRAVDAQVFRFGPFEKPGKPKTYALDLNGYDPTKNNVKAGLRFSAEVDSWAEEPTIWLYPGTATRISPTGYAGESGKRKYWHAPGIRLLKIKGGTLEVVKDFEKISISEVLKTRRVDGSSRNLTVNPKTGNLWIGDGSATEGFSWSLSVRANPNTGNLDLKDLPFDCEQMAFDLDGLAYLRARNILARFEPTKWREVPFDYGEELKDVGVASTAAKGPGMRRVKNLISGLVFPGWSHAPQGSFNISPKGNIVLSIKGHKKTTGGILFKKGEEPGATVKAKPFQLKLYPGRPFCGVVWVYNRHGKLLSDDAVPGLTYTHGVMLDRDDNVYASVMGTRVLDGKPYHNPATNTLIKFKLGAARIVGNNKKGGIAVDLPPNEFPKRPPDFITGGKPASGKTWVTGAEWFYGGVGYNGEHYKNPDLGCDCNHSNFNLDFFARSFVPEVEHCSVAVLDSGGNLITRIGTYGNVDDGKPLIDSQASPHVNAMGGDEVGLFYAPHLATHTDKRLFIADVGNERIVSVKLGYHQESRVNLKDIPNQKGE